MMLKEVGLFCLAILAMGFAIAFVVLVGEPWQDVGWRHEGD